MSDVQEQEQQETEGKHFKAKSISKLFKFIAPIGLVTCAVLKWNGILANASIVEIVLVWSAVYGLGAGTIDANLMIDKFRK